MSVEQAVCFLSNFVKKSTKLTACNGFRVFRSFLGKRGKLQC
ncbi:hypothetical protein appser11_20160 [Actinobacillus pleuropneumoniae serovar 11 str. 56153]|uniref:Uncharacterized protein n=1 Tax=Actinobacillus pleuropneumoniae serovar 6 str. Femo TaxID=754256 RepID=A0A828PRU2_ACTPL|nr:hypothetical protein appser4_18970 [Actinobacillus pleuropneumoniae serovar 4 str. M62]EFM90980.1 hypothetical protein appser6_20460 [Actinobacillus pleuropneumoniae serovar 6 str. Femo]EFM93237.1 hypothetical protein appser9_20040 [Actinobacillus pleuropneumoniae serovar 9 str. CVJ13261]EFM95448.1 hypothetical protein appser10_19520 [Actinobacillus pleuropneumoniae serovar 10 str. D13039]EFM97561.1 hypothetical protein appser11_20160 [Actinobacillus pleuropneumoniae serovar 11 str. 56153]